MKLCVYLSNSLSIALVAALMVQTIPAADLQTENSGITLLAQKARSLEARDREDLAAQVWRQVLLADPNYPDALAGLARWAKQSGNNNEASAYLDRLRRVSPQSPALTESSSGKDSVRQGTAHLNEAGRLAAAGQYDEAMRIYREAFGSNPPLGNWTIAYYETLANTAGGFDSAIAALKKLASDYPAVPAYSISAGRLMTYRPATRRAGIAMLSAAADATATGAKAREAWRQALLWERANPSFVPDYQAYLNRYNDPELQKASESLRTRAADTQLAGSPEEQLGYKALKAGNVQQAEEQFTKALGKGSENVRAHAGLGFARMKAGDFDAAVEQFELARKASPKDAAARNALASAKFWQAMSQGAKSASEGEWTAAVARYQAASALRPEDPDATRALGGALLAAGSPDKALPFLSKTVHAQPSDLASWCALARATLQNAGGAQALALMHSAPESSLTALNRRIEWKALEASAYLDAGHNDQALQIYRALVGTEHPDLTGDEQIQLASLALRFRLPEEALPFARKAVENSPAKPGAWEILVSTLVASKRFREAERVYARMPAKAGELALSHPGFRDSLASLKEANGDLDAARNLLEQSLAAPEASMTEPDRVSMRLHLAQLLVKSNRADEAGTVLAAITESHPADTDAWRAYLLVLQTLGRDNEIVNAALRVPQPAMVHLSAQGDIAALLARAYANTGDPAAGIRLLDTYLAHPAPSDSSAGLPERIELGWLLLNSPGGSARLYSVLDDLSARKNLTSGQQKELDALWSTWIQRTAEAARVAGNPARALELLERGSRMFPKSVEIQRSLAGSLLAAGYSKRALNVYSNWGLSGANAEDYAGAIGAAQAERNMQFVDTWLSQAVAQWPHNPKILTLAGERAQSHGELDKARTLFKAALVEQQAQSDEQTASSGTAVPSSLKTLLVESESPQRPSQPEIKAALRSSSYLPDGAPAEDFVRTTPPIGDLAPASSAIGVDLLPKALLTATPPSDSLEDKIAALESRNTPYLGSSMSVRGRDGQAGFSRMLTQQASFEASTTLADSVRASLLVQPTYLSSGTASGTGDTLFGKQSVAASFGPQSASGVGAEAQLSTNWLGLRLGATPQGFPTHSWTGGFRLQPGDGPIAFLLERDSMTDSILSYAGAHDPQSGQIWGGVMANTASLQGHWGSDRSGFYINGGYQVLEGRNVARNTAANGNLGTWWKLATLRTGSITAGMNFSAMHYDLNLRYFTFGQGGYFSPQQYFLFNAPVRWTGYYGRRLQYVISGSLGLQHFVEDGSDYYPTDAALQTGSGLSYQPLSNTGANFNFDARLNFQLTPHYLLGAFATANNARDYTAAGAGVFMKYSFEDRPMTLGDLPASVPDWKGKQPFVLQ